MTMITATRQQATGRIVHNGRTGVKMTDVRPGDYVQTDSGLYRVFDSGVKLQMERVTDTQLDAQFGPGDWAVPAETAVICEECQAELEPHELEYSDAEYPICVHCLIASF